MANYLKKIILIEITKNDCWIPINFWKNGDGYIGRKPIHREIYKNFYGLGEGQIVRHKCNNRPCLNIDHLLSGSHADNVADRVKANRSARGAHNGRAKLTKLKVKKIRALKGSSVSELSRKFKVDRHLIRKIRNGELWNHS